MISKVKKLLLGSFCQVIQGAVKNMMAKKMYFKYVLHRLNRYLTEDMTDFDVNADYDTRVKLPEWQLKKLKNRKLKNK